VAIDGGGSGGGPIGASNSFTGPSESFELVGDHGYGYASVSIPANSLTTMLKFRTGNFYTVAKWQIEGNFQTIGNDAIQYVLLLNGSTIVDTSYSPANDVGYADTPTHIIIPAYTEVETQMTHNQGGQNITFQSLITGRIYRG